MTTTTARSVDHRLPLWLRVTAIAVEESEIDVLGTYTASFRPGELRELLAQGEALAHSSVTRAIRLAEQHGLLAKGSSTRCLRVIPGSLTTESPGR
jgi:hypothetical protein